MFDNAISTLSLNLSFLGKLMTLGILECKGASFGIPILMMVVGV